LFAGKERRKREMFLGELFGLFIFSENGSGANRHGPPVRRGWWHR
jgi:hypothetical protein